MGWHETDGLYLHVLTSSFLPPHFIIYIFHGSLLEYILFDRLTCTDNAYSGEFLFPRRAFHFIVFIVFYCLYFCLFRPQFLSQSTMWVG